MKYCPACNSEYADKFRFCRLDGAALVGKRLAETNQRDIETEQAFHGMLSDQTAVGASREGADESTGGFFRDGGRRENREHHGTRPAASERFELLAQQKIKKAFPSAFVRSGVQVRSLKMTAQVDLFVLLPNGVFLIECKNYPGKISGSFNYDQKQGEFWSCETPSGENVQIKSSGKNPADQALNGFHALRDMADAAWGKQSRPYICPVLLFPDAADLSQIRELTVHPERPSTGDRVVATTLSRVIGYMANADSKVEQTGALKLIVEFLGVPRDSIAGTWLDQPFKPEDRPPKQAFKQASSFPQEPKGAFAEDQYSFDEVPQTEQRAQGHPLTRGALVATAAVVIGVLFLFIIGRQIFYSGSTKLPDLTSRQEAPQPQPLEPAPPLVPVPEAEYSSLTLENSRDQEKAVPDPQYGKALPAGKIPPSKAQESPGASPTAEAKLDERPVTGRPAEPGTYETIRPTYARTQPNNSADVVDEIGSGIRLNVVSSEGSWLIVRSKKRQATVYVKRDDAMFVSPNRPPRESFQEDEARWKKFDAEISAALAQRGIAGVTVSFIGDTAFLKGQVKTDYERFLAEQVARSFPEVQHIHNGIWVVP